MLINKNKRALWSFNYPTSHCSKASFIEESTPPWWEILFWLPKRLHHTEADTYTRRPLLEFHSEFGDPLEHVKDKLVDCFEKPNFRIMHMSSFELMTGEARLMTLKFFTTFKNKKMGWMLLGIISSNYFDYRLLSYRSIKFFPYPGLNYFQIGLYCW